VPDVPARIEQHRVDEHVGSQCELPFGRRLQRQPRELRVRLLDRRDVLRAERDGEQRLPGLSACGEHDRMDERQRCRELSIGRGVQRRELRDGLLDRRDLLHAERHDEQRVRGVRARIEHHSVDIAERARELSCRGGVQRRELRRGVFDRRYVLRVRRDE
jgi:hypothetical protein